MGNNRNRPNRGGRPPQITWRPSDKGGWFARDEYGNHWYLTANMERVTLTTQDGDRYNGWTPETAWKAMREDA